MTVKLSERLSMHLVWANKAGDVDLADALREAARIARAWEDAPSAKVRGKVGEVCMVPVSHDFCGKRVKLVEVDDGRS